MASQQQVSATVMVNSSGRLLVVRRSQKETFLPGIFELPGGKLKFGESPDDAATREVREETGLQIDHLQLVLARSYLSPNGSQHKVELFYTAEACQDVLVTLSNAHDDFRWIEATELDSLGLPAEDPVRGIIESYFARRLESK